MYAVRLFGVPDRSVARAAFTSMPTSIFANDAFSSKPTRPSNAAGFLNVPKTMSQMGKVGIVEGVDVQLVVVAMRLGPLEDVTHPLRRPDVPVLEHSGKAQQIADERRGERFETQHEHRRSQHDDVLHDELEGVKITEPGMSIRWGAWCI